MVSHIAQLTIILGSPASGKTTLARRLAEQWEEIERRFTERRRHPGHLDADMPRGELEKTASLPPLFLDLPGDRQVFASDDTAAFQALIQAIKATAL